jgi:uncharacterized protein YuzE
MSITIDGIEFDHHSYDERGDVLYLSIGKPQVAAETDATPEGHAVDFDADENVIGMVLVNVRRLMERDGKLVVTWPDGHVSHDAPASVLPTAA